MIQESLLVALHGVLRRTYDLRAPLFPIGSYVIGDAGLRLLYPNEDWPARIGLFAFFGYCTLALPLTVLWFRRFPRGPLESLWNRLG